MSSLLRQCALAGTFVVLLNACGRATGGSSSNGSSFNLGASQLIGCGPTKLAPARLGENGAETFGCTVLSRSEKRRVVSDFSIERLVLVRSGATTFVPDLVRAPEDSPWDVFFSVPPGIFPVTRAEAIGTYDGDLVALTNDGLPVYDPENLSTLDDTLNTFIIPKPEPSFQKLDGHILLVTEDALVPGRDFDSLAAADQRCATDIARLPHLSIYRWTALLSDETTDARDRIALHGPVRNVDGTVMAPAGTVDSLFSTAGFQGLLKLTKGNPATNALRVWTGSDASGRRIAGETCDSWSSQMTAAHGELGNPSTERWTEESDAACDRAQRLYCISR